MTDDKPTVSPPDDLPWAGMADDPETIETPGYKLWAAMNDAETYEPELSEIDIWEYAANTFLESFKEQVSMPLTTIEAAYQEAFDDFEANPGSVVKFGRMDALAAVLTAARNGGPVILNPTGSADV